MPVDNFQSYQQEEAQIVIGREGQDRGMGGGKSTKRFQNRSAMVLTANILRVAAQGIGRTHLMYKANLSHRMLNSYLAYLLGLGLIATITSQTGGRTIYRTTEKGKKYIEVYDSLLGLSNGMGKFSAFSDPFDGIEREPMGGGV